MWKYTLTDRSKRARTNPPAPLASRKPTTILSMSSSSSQGRKLGEPMDWHLYKYYKYYAVQNMWVLISITWNYWQLFASGRRRDSFL